MSDTANYLLIGLALLALVRGLHVGAQWASDCAALCGDCLDGTTACGCRCIPNTLTLTYTAVCDFPCTSPFDCSTADFTLALTSVLVPACSWEGTHGGITYRLSISGSTATLKQVGGGDYGSGAFACDPFSFTVTVGPNEQFCFAPAFTPYNLTETYTVSE